jgi:hypothetical protein
VTWYAFLAVKKEATYRIRDWSEYNASLKRRGRLTIWVSSEAVKNRSTDEARDRYSCNKALDILRLFNPTSMIITNCDFGAVCLCKPNASFRQA